MEVKCAVGKKCLYNDKKSMAKGKINPATKSKIVGKGASKSVAAGTKPKSRALAQKKTTVKSKSAAVKSTKKPVVAKKPISQVKATKPKMIAKAKTATPSKSIKTK